jgi:integrase/recombinase XerD
MSQPTQLPALDPLTAEQIDDVLIEWHATDKARTAAMYTMRTFSRWLAANRPGTGLMDATQADCAAFLKYRGSVVADSTVAKNWGDMRAFYTAAASDPTDPLDGRRSPMDRIKMPRHAKFAITHVATVAEVDKLIAGFDLRTTLGLRNATMVSLMFRSGLRVSEVAKLFLHDVDLDARYVMLGLTKNLEPRQPALHPETLTLLRRYLRRRGDVSGPLFINVGRRAKGLALPVDAIKTMVKRNATRAGVPVTPHSLRRGFVVEYLTHGGDVPTLMINGGWSSEVMIYRYMGEQRAKTAQAVFDVVAQRQVAARRLRSVS